MKYLLGALLCLSSLAYAQDVETRHIDEFEGVHVSHGIEVILVSGKPGTIEVETRHIDPDDVETYVSRGELRIKFKSSSIWDWEDNKGRDRYVTVTVPFEHLLSVESNTGALVRNRGTITGRDLHLESSTGGEMELEVHVDRLDADFNMGSVSEVKGQAKMVRVKANMGAVVDFKHLQCETVEAKANMGAVLDFHASKEADVTANMGAVINVYGSPERRYTSHSFGGEIDFEGNY